MRAILLLLPVVLLETSFAVGAEPLVEGYLHSGRLARGEQVMESALAANPADDQLRFGLAMLQLVRGFERVGQSLYQYGCLTENRNLLMLRMPVPMNPDPSVISYPDLCRFLEVFRSDLERVEATLAEVKSADVTLPLRLADIRVNLTGKPEASERFVDLLKKMMGPNFRVPAENAEFLIRFDRGDVAWLRGYCHLLMGLIDLTLAFDLEENFTMWGDQQFAKTKRSFQGTPAEKSKRQAEISAVIKIKEPARLGHYRRHIVKVCALNRETWSFIRAETDDDHEWLPNSKQTGVLRIPVTDEMIDHWLAMMAEFEDLFDGRKAIPKGLVAILSSKSQRPLNVRAFFDNPPDTFEWQRMQRDGVREQYLDDSLPDFDLNVIIRGGGVFQSTLGIGYAVWFN